MRRARPDRRRRPRALALAVASWPSALAAQTAPDEFTIYPDTTTFTSRSGVAGANAGYICVCTPEHFFRGVGQAGANAPGRVRGFRAVIQDQNAATREAFRFFLLGADPTRPTDPSAARPLGQGPDVTPPAGPAAPRAWVFTQNLQTAIDALPPVGSWYLAVRMPANATWTRDGLSLHGASYASGTRGDNPAEGTETLHRAINLPAATVTRAGSGRTHRIGVLTGGAVLNTGADIATASRRGPNPCFGAAGVFPSSSLRGDGTAFRVRDRGNAGGRAVVGFATGFAPAALPLPGFGGGVWIDAASLTLIASAPIGASGQVVIAPPFLAQGNPVTRALRGILPFQAATLGAGGSRFSNAAAVGYR